MAGAIVGAMEEAEVVVQLICAVLVMNLRIEYW